MSGPVKYLFGESFDEEEIDEKEVLASELRALLRTDFDAELELAKKKAYDEGFQAGLESAKADNEVALRISNEDKSVKLEQLNGVMTQLLNRYEGLLQSFNDRATEFRDQAVLVGVQAAEVVAQGLVKDRPLGTLEDAFRNVLKHIGQDLKVSISVPEVLLEEARDRVSELAEMHGFEGKLVFLSDTELPVGNWKVEWGEGGILKNLDAVQTQVHREVSRYLTGVDVSLEPETDVKQVVNESADSKVGDQHGPGDEE